MITYQTGNILYDQADAIINTVNTVGVMGKGLALQFKKALVEKGWQYLDGLETSEPNCYAWVQTGDLDNMGHAQQGKMPLHIDAVLF
jgi:O-acetyl-ADP-ribose deacetylase (regulator of RNase III)